MTLTEKMLLSDDPEAVMIEHEEQEMINDRINSVIEWDKKGETRMFIFFCDPLFAARVKAGLSKYSIQTQGVSMYGWLQVEFTVSK